MRIENPLFAETIYRLPLFADYFRHFVVLGVMTIVAAADMGLQRYNALSYARGLLRVCSGSRERGRIALRGAESVGKRKFAGQGGRLT